MRWLVYLVKCLLCGLLAMQAYFAVQIALWITLDQDLMDIGDSQEPGQATEEFAAGILRGHAAAPEEIVGTALYLASSDSDYLTGQVIMIDGGMVLI